MKRSNTVVKRILFLFAGIIFSAAICLGINDAQTRFQDFIYAQISVPGERVAIVMPEKKELPTLELAANAAFSLMINEQGAERVLYDKNADQVLPVASLTKLMTATVVIEHPEIYGMNRQIEISAAAANQDDVPVFGNLMVGQVYSVERLLNLMLYYSSNDAALALAEAMGSDAFVKEMNRKANELGLSNTIFYNPHGLDRVDGLANISSISDLRALVKYILNSHQEILNFSTLPGPYLNENGIFSLNLWDGQNLIGGKTGYTQKAGGCMVVVFKDNAGRYFINIILGAASSESRVLEMQKLINFVSNPENRLYRNESKVTALTFVNELNSSTTKQIDI